MTAGNFRRIRAKLGLTQAELADVLALSSARVVSNIEIGFRKPSKLAVSIFTMLDNMPLSAARKFADKLAKQARAIN